MKIPETIKKTARTWTVQVGLSTIKVVRRRATNKKHWNKGEARMVPSNWVYDCPDLNLEGVNRLTVEASIWRLAGLNLERLDESLDQWKL